MKQLKELEKKLDAQSKFKSIEALEAQIPDDPTEMQENESTDDWLKRIVGEDTWNKIFEV